MSALFKKNLMGHPWDKLYWTDVEQTGAIFEYAYKIAEVNMYDFVNKYMNSAVRECMDGWHAQYTNGPVDWVFDVCVDCCGEFESIDKSDNKQLMWPDEARWIGMAYMVIRYYTSLTSSEIFKIAGLDTMREWYHFGHEVSWDNFINTVIDYDVT